MAKQDMSKLTLKQFGSLIQVTGVECADSQDALVESHKHGIDVEMTGKKRTEMCSESAIEHTSVNDATVMRPRANRPGRGLGRIGQPYRALNRALYYII